MSKKILSFVLVFSFIISGFNFFDIKKAEASFAPSDINGLAYWFDASQGVYTDTSLITAATLNGDAIAGWHDLSSGNNDVIQSNSGNRPTLKLSAVNGLASMVFDGNDYIATSTGSSNANSITMFMVLKPYARNKSQAYVTVGNNGYLYAPNQGKPYVVAFAQSTAYSSDTSLSIDENFQMLSFIASSTQTQFRVNGRSVNAQAASSFSFSGLTFGGITGGGSNFNGEIAAYIMYNRPLNPTEISNIESYLNTRYNLPPPISSSSNFLLLDGDSITAGVSSSDNNHQINNLAVNTISTPFISRNIAISGSLVSDLSARSTFADSFYNSSRLNNIMSIFIGTNDIYLNNISATTTYASLVTYSQARRATGYKTIIFTMLPRVNDATFETKRLVYNNFIRNNWRTFADGLVDVATSTLIGQFGQDQNTTYYADGTHPNDAGNAIIAQYLTSAVNQIVSPNTPTSIVSTPTSSSAIITWTTNQLSSTKVNYGLTSSYGTSTAETNTSPFVLSHTVNLNGLNTCTTYHYQVVSNDLNGLSATSNDQIFTTSGCAITPVKNNSVIAPQTSAGGYIAGPVVITPAATTTTSAGNTTVVCANGERFNTQSGQPCPATTSATATPTTSPSFAPTPQNFVFTRNLQLGSNNSEVKLLQQFLNYQGYTVSNSGAGSKGSETTYFGQATKKALSTFQQENNINPAAGYFGPLTRAFINNIRY